MLEADVIATIGVDSSPAIAAAQLVYGNAMRTGIEQCNGKRWTVACGRAVGAVPNSGDA